MVHFEKNIIIEGEDGRPMALDVFYQEGTRSPVIIYAHGFNGFKDWGNFDIIARQFAESGFSFVKFNFSHNGTTPIHPEEFTDLQAFGNNNYSKELNDLQKVIDWVVDETNPYKKYFEDFIGLIGHSMGGGIALVKASEEKRIRAVASWASVAELKTPWGNWNEEKIRDWQKAGIAYYLNGRTGQNMPLFYQLYEDFKMNSARLNVLSAVAKLDIPVLVCHGRKDPAVNVGSAEQIAAAAKHATLVLNDSDHVFGRMHPWPENSLPPDMQQIVDETIKFFKLNRYQN
jgi:uncharacterized protein